MAGGMNQPFVQLLELLLLMMSSVLDPGSKAGPFHAAESERPVPCNHLDLTQPPPARTRLTNRNTSGTLFSRPISELTQPKR